MRRVIPDFVDKVYEYYIKGDLPEGLPVGSVGDVMFMESRSFLPFGKFYDRVKSYLRGYLKMEVVDR